jgi:hypothetical protein
VIYISADVIIFWAFVVVAGIVVMTANLMHIKYIHYYLLVNS